MSTLSITVSEHLRLPQAQISARLRKFLHEKLFIINSEYIIKERLGKSVYNVPKFFDLIETDSDQFLLPVGFLGELITFLDKERLDYTLNYNHPDFAAQTYQSTITLRTAQEVIVTQALAASSGVIVVDECHHIPPRTFRTVISRLNTPHIYGLTATPGRKHNDERLIYLYIGKIVATLPTTITHDQRSSISVKVRETSLRRGAAISDRLPR